MPLRVGIVSQAFHPAVGGVTEHVDQCARALTERGHDVAVITARFPGYAEPTAPYRVLRIGTNIVVPYNGAENNVTVGFRLGAKLAERLDAERFDVLHVHCPVSPMLPLAAVRAAKIPVVGTFHSSVISDLAFRLFRKALLPAYRRIDRVLAVSKEARDCVLRHFPGPVGILPNGVNLHRFRPGLSPLPRFDDGTPNILFVGRHDPRKGLPELMHAARLLAGRGVRFRLILVGDGPMKGRIERMADGPLHGRVHFEGCVSNEHLPAYYASADIFCSPARGGESFGIVLLEAMASGAPIVATDLPGYRTALTPGIEGLMVPPRDPRALADALGQLLADPMRGRDLGARGVETAQRFAWPSIAEGLERVYHSLVSPSTAVSPEAEPGSRAAILEPAQV